MWIDKLLRLADRLPSGRVDPRSREKLSREWEELFAAGEDRLGAILEAGDVAYYAAKCTATWHLNPGEAWAQVVSAAVLVGVSPLAVLVAAETKYSLRARHGNPKNDEEEREAVARALRGIGVEV